MKCDCQRDKYLSKFKCIKFKQLKATLHPLKMDGKYIPDNN